MADNTIFPEDAFADLTVESLSQQQEVSAEQDEQLPIEDETIEETPEEEVIDEEEAAIEEDEDVEKPADDKPVEKVEGIAEVRKAYERASTREKQLTEEVTQINTVFEDLGADAKTVADVVKEYGGIEQLKVGTQIYKLVTDNAGDTESLLRQAQEIIPDTVSNLVTYIAEEVEKDFAVEYQQRVFGRTLTKEEVVGVRDFLDFGTTRTSDIPSEMLNDEFGNPLPEKTQAAVRAMWDQNKVAHRQIADLSSRIDKKFSTLESGTQTRMRDDYMASAFSPMLEVGKELGLDKAVQGEEKAQLMRDAAALEALTFKFFSGNPAADRSLTQALETLGKTDAASRAKHADATRQVQKYAKIAAQTAASYLAPKAQAQAKRVTEGSEQKGAKEPIKGSAKAAGNNRQVTERAADNWDDLTVESLSLKPIRGRR